MTDGFRIGAFIRDLRKDRGVTQDELARLTDRSVDAVSQIERDVNSPSIDTFLRIASALDVTPAAFFVAFGGGSQARQRDLLRGIAELGRLNDRDLEVAVRQLQAFKTN